MTSEKKIRHRIKILIVLFIVGLVLSGVTAFPIESQLAIAYGNISLFPEFMREWITSVYFAVKTTNETFPYLSYGTDWLAFAHIVIAVAFIGPLRDPVKNIWVIEFGMIACVMVFPLALIAGPIRQIPFYWRLIDCSFGVFGMALLYVCYQNILALIKLQESN
ncbi:hypothetical protein GXP67_01680 [Rhodocytophaga rosea]|uniref:Uncharacterized protein n=1 Tax=Rhodocytophaga rosea TaxID=2704465 RepID=A0A6C0GCC1_9BACT|nr:hypothetical protein [Rhodocytophaga rosea]QHT65473.1 hypothetical protein GXP67_01680 [Rhodocytophaga rosea]